MFICTWYLKKRAVVESAGLVILQACGPRPRSANPVTSLSLIPLTWRVWAWSSVAFQMYQLLQFFGTLLFHGVLITPIPGCLALLVAPSGYPGSADCQTTLTAPVAARRWHFGIFRSWRTNHRRRKHLGFCFADQNRISRDRNNQGAMFFMFACNKWNWLLVVVMAHRSVGLNTRIDWCNNHHSRETESSITPQNTPVSDSPWPRTLTSTDLLSILRVLSSRK